MAILSDRDRRYFAKASQDGDFGALRSDIERLFRDAVIHPGPLAQAAQARLTDVSRSVQLARISVLDSPAELAIIERIECELASAGKSINTLDVDIEGVNKRLHRMKVELDGITKQNLTKRISSCEQWIATCEHTKTFHENRLEQLKHQIEHASGKAAAWAFFFIFLICGGFLLGIVASLVSPVLRQSVEWALPWLVLAIGILGAVMGNVVSRGRQKRYLGFDIEKSRREIDECVGMLNRHKQSLQAYRQELATVQHPETQ